MEKRAIQRIVRDNEGRLRIILIDADTLQEVTNPAGYRILTANTFIEPVVSVEDPDPQSIGEPEPITPEDQAVIDQYNAGMSGTGDPTGQIQQTSVQGNTTSTPTDLSASIGSSQPTSRSSVSNSIADVINNNQRNSASISQVGRNVGYTPPTTQSSSTSETPAPTDNTGNRPSGTQVASLGTPAGSLANQGRAGFINDFASAQHRTETPDQGFIDTVRDSVGNTRGLGAGYSVRGYSGKDPDGTSYSGSGRHEHGKGMDFNVVDSQGNTVTDTNKLNDVVSQYAYDNPTAGVGFGRGYMGAGIHADLSGKGGQWGARGKNANMSSALNETIDAARQGNLPTPFDNPGMPYSRDEEAPAGYTAPASNIDSAGTQIAGSAIDASGNQRAGTASAAALDTAIGRDMTKNPADLASLGYMSISEQDIANMGYAFSGELGPKSLAEISNPDSVARQELNNMVGTAINRATALGTSVTGVLSPSQYNSLMDDKRQTTTGNFTKYGQAVIDAIKDFVSPQTANFTNNNTHYYNPDIANPSWGQTGMFSATSQDVGDHRFGKADNLYSTPESFSDINSNPGLNSYARDQINNMSSKGGFQADLGRFGDMTSAVSKSNGESQGGRGRGGFAASSAEGKGTSSSNSRGGFGSGGIGSDRGQDGKGSSGKSGAADKGTSTYGGAASSGDTPSSGRSGGSKSSGGATGRTGKSGVESGPGTGGQQGKGGRNTD